MPNISYQALRRPNSASASAKTSKKIKIPADSSLVTTSNSSKLPLPIRRPNASPFLQGLSSADLGQRVLVFGEKRGYLRYIGPTHFDTGEWCGVELDLPEGKNEGHGFFQCLPNHGLFVPSYQVELLKPKKFSLCLREIESSSSSSSSSIDNRRKMKPSRPMTSTATTKIPQKIRKRHLAGLDQTKAKNNEALDDIKDDKVKSRPLQLKSTKSSDMDSSLGILSPSDMKTSWTTSVMTRSRTFTKELNDPKAENDLIVEDLEQVDSDEKRMKKKKKPLKRFKLNTVQLEQVDDETSILVSRTEALLSSTSKMNAIKVTPVQRDHPALSSFPDVSESLKSRTESLLHSKSSNKKRRKKKPIVIPENNTDSSGSSWSNIPAKCLTNASSSVLSSSDAGISSMPSSMISNPSEEAKKSSSNAQPDVLQTLDNPKEVTKWSLEKGLASKRAELLAENPIVPNKDVGSKVKEILNANAGDKGKVREKVKGKWDDIMDKIVQGQKKGQDINIKEVKSKVFADFKPPKIIRPTKLMSSRSNSSMSSNGLLQVNSRSTSSASVASQIIKENMDDNASECTLKDGEKNLPFRSTVVVMPRKDFIKNNAAAVSRKNSTATTAANQQRKSSAKVPTSLLQGSNPKKDQPNLVQQSSHHHHQQPDLIKVSSPKVLDNNGELVRLKSSLEEKTRENFMLKTRIGHSAKGFAALAVTVDYFAKKADEEVEWQQKYHDLIINLTEKDAELAELKRLLEKENEYKTKDDKEGLIERLQGLLEEREFFLQKVQQDHKTELDLLRESHKIELKGLENAHNGILADHEARHEVITKELTEEWKLKMSQLLEDKQVELHEINANFQRQAEKWGEMQRQLEDQLHSVQAELKNQELALSAKQKGDVLVKSNLNKLSKVMAEVDSLKAVLDMKTEEIHALRLDKARLEDKLEEFDQTRIAFAKVQAQLEDLSAQLNEKQALERKLSEENRQLYDSMEREINAKRRLTMEKEELEWRMKSISDAPMSMSMMEGYDGSMMTSTPAFSKGALTVSYTEHCPQSLPPFTGRMRKSRPVSAPLGKFDLSQLSKSLKDQAGPDSPRLLEVVQKSDSLAWKIEYQETSTAESSPVPRRKATPPITLRSSPVVASLPKKKIIPTFEPLSESAESDSLEEPSKVLELSREPSKDPFAEDDLDLADIDISSSSELEIDEPLAEVTTPQIEALMFATPMLTQSEPIMASLSSPDAEVTIRAEIPQKKTSSSSAKMSGSLPTYDLNKLFNGVQDSGGEALVNFPDED